MSLHSFNVEAIVLKRSNYGEADRIVTLFTKDSGKWAVIAKGVRKANSKRAASIEVGTQIKAMVIKGHGMDILGQTIILNSFSQAKQNLVNCTQLYQLLEVVDSLTQEDQSLPEIYEILINTLMLLPNHTQKKVLLLQSFKDITHILGFTPPEDISELALKNYIESIAERKLKSKDFLNTKS